ncbi:MAG: biliverdin-producing heme oxygenase [Microbacterium sp.]
MDIDGSVVTAVTGHMNGDHPEDNLVIAQAFGHPEAVAASMTGLDGAGATWLVTDPHGEHRLTLPWPHEIVDRPDIRKGVVKLYREACRRLGVEARQEHGQAPHAHAVEDVGSGFAKRVREATWGDHADSEGAGFMAGLMRGNGTFDDYVQLVVQHWFMYDALEDAATQLAGHPVVAALHPPALLRSEALDRDLVHLIGVDWRDRIRAVPAADAYAARIRAVAAEGWIAGIVAHHYTRYLGDLSGGQVIARRMARQFGLDAEGVAFYDFSALSDLTGFKDDYRRVLDAFGETLDAAEQTRMLDEVRTAYRFNTEVFDDLAAVRAV